MQRWLVRFETALAKNDLDAATDLFEEECYWRDLVAFTWNIRTCEGRAEIKAMLAATLAATEPSHFTLHGKPSANEGWFSFETRVGRGIGHIRIRMGSGSGSGEKCWTLLTTMQELKGFEEKAGLTREAGVEHGVIAGRRNWLERREAVEQDFTSGNKQPYVMIIGGGQGGIALAARLKRLEVPAIVIEKNERAGDSWRKRYKSLCLHDPVWYDHLPYLPFPDHWPVFSPKDKIADWLEMYTTVMELNYWSSTTCVGARFNEEVQDWSVDIYRDGKTLTLRPKHLVLATGMSGYANVPHIAGAESYTGRLVHSSEHLGPEGWQDKPCVVIGSSTSAHDIAADLWEHGADVTMVQRAPTVVVRSESLMKHAWAKLYSEQAVQSGITTEIADLTTASVPFKVLPRLHKPVYDQIRKEDAALYAGLEKAGFQFDFGEDGAGIHATYLRRGAGYYIDVGASEMIIDGRIKLKSNTGVERINARSVTLTDGTELPADLIVLATGYGSMNQWAEKLISKEVADKVGKVWGLGSATKHDPGPWVGELRNMWKPTQQPGLWFHGGNLMQARHYSLYLALQLKARLENIPTPVYFIDPVHHLQ